VPPFSGKGPLERATTEGCEALETGTRRFALSLGRALELALLVRHAQWVLDHGVDDGSSSTAARLARSAVDLVGEGLRGEVSQASSAIVYYNTVGT
jgi:hypothetical protein